MKRGLALRPLRAVVLAAAILAGRLSAGLLSAVLGPAVWAQNPLPPLQAPPALQAAVAHIESPTFVDPRELTRFRDGLLFNAWHQEGGQALWWLDADGSQVRLLTPARPGFRGTAPGGFVVWGGLAYFRANDGMHGAELWRTDATLAGTRMVSDVLAGAEGSTPAFLTVFDGALFFVAREPALQVYRLWRLNAGAALPQRVAAAGSLTNVRHLTVAGGRLYFSATTTKTGNELWVMDHAQAAPRLLRDIRSGPEDGMPEHMTPVRTARGDRLFFVATDGRHGWELWRSDGTRPGTVMVRNIRPGADASRPSYLQAVGDRLFFAADDGIHGNELWRSDGTLAGTTLVRDIRPGPGGSGVSVVVACGGRAWFAAHDGQSGLEPWASDGTAQGTQAEGDLHAGAASSTPHELSCVEGQLLMAAFAQAPYATPWRWTGERFEPLAAPDDLAPLAAPSRFTALPRGRIAWVARDVLGNDRLYLRDADGRLRRVGAQLLEKWSAGR